MFSGIAGAKYEQPWRWSIWEKILPQKYSSTFKAVVTKRLKLKTFRLIFSARKKCKEPELLKVLKFYR